MPTLLLLRYEMAMWDFKSKPVSRQVDNSTLDDQSCCRWVDSWRHPTPARPQGGPRTQRARVCLKEKNGVEVGLVDQPLDALNGAPCCGRGSRDYLGRAISISAHVYRHLMHKIEKRVN